MYFPQRIPARLVSRAPLWPFPRAMLITAQLDLLIKTLLSDDLKTKHSGFSELLDMIETFLGLLEYEYFLAQLMPVFLSHLQLVPVSFSSAAPENRVRNAILEVLHRLVMNDIFEPYAAQVLDVLQELLASENEDNGVLCIKIITLLHKAYKLTLEDRVQLFIDIVITIYKNMPSAVLEAFNQEQEGSPDPSGLPLSIDETPHRQLKPAMSSFKTVAECPITMVSLYSSYKHLVNLSLPQLVPHIIDILLLQARPQMEARAAAEAKGERLTLASLTIKNRADFGDFVLGQVKAASFLAYIFIRGYAAVFLKQYHTAIPELVLRILQDCPLELSSARKELLHSTRHILSTHFRTMFLPQCDALLDEQVLIGDGLTAHENLRVLAYSMVADFIHIVRAELSQAQVVKAIHMFVGILQDDSLSLTVQVMSSKLLLNLVEIVRNMPNKEDTRGLFMLIIDGHVKRFSSLNRRYEEIVGSQPAKKKDDETEMDVDEPAKPLVLPISVAPPSPTLLKDTCFLYRSLFTFLKAVIFALKSLNPPPPAGVAPETWGNQARIFSPEEVWIFQSLFREGILALRYFRAQRPAESPPAAFDISGPNIPVNSTKEENEIMELFATIFIHIDAATFNEVAQAEMEFLYREMIANSALLHVPQFFLANEVTSQNFSGILTAFGKSKLAELGDLDAARSNILVRLFKLCFMSVNLFPTLNEQVILPHLNNLILDLLALTATAKQPLVYFYLIRTLFRSIGGGRFGHLYKEIIPLLPSLLETLNRMIVSARRPQERDIYVELCLTVPVRLLVLVPHLQYLMRPLVHALNGSQDLVLQGLRTLELCVDNLTAEYFDPIIDPVIEEVMAALWKHLKPLPYIHQHSHTTFRVLGKLGGRNRRFVKPPHDLHTVEALNVEARAFFKVNGLPTKLSLSVTPGITAAVKLLEDPRLKVHYRVSAFNYLTAVLKLYVGAQELPENYAQTVARCVAQVEEEVPEETPSPALAVDLPPARLTSDQQLVQRLIEGVFYAVSIPEVSADAKTLLNGLATHVAFLCVGRFLVAKRKTLRPFSTGDAEGKVHLDERVFFEAILYALSHYVSDIRDSGVAVLSHVCATIATILPSDSSTSPSHQLLLLVFSTLLHLCYDEMYYRKLGGVLGLRTLIDTVKVPASWLAPYQFEFTRAMFFVLRDTPVDAPSEVAASAQALVLQVIGMCNLELSAEELAAKPFQTFVALLVYDLGNANETVRRCAETCLTKLASVTGSTLSALIAPSKSVLLTPIFTKPLRALPFPMQIGNLDAITLCLGLPDSFLQYNAELDRLLGEALTLVEAEDESLTSALRVKEHRTSEQLVQLRVACIRLLSLALQNQEFVASNNGQMRIRILAVFFKTLTLSSTAVMDASHQGLKLVLSQNAKVPKELLQSGLKPMLIRLSDHKRLTVPGLAALARLLELLISYFKVEIGRKLLDHLRAWAQPLVLQQVASQELDTNPTVQIIVAILNIFHRLPPQAYIYMEEIMQTVQYLEENLHRALGSPFRQPTALFVDRFPEQAFEYFVEHFGNRNIGQRFAWFVGCGDCPRFRLYVAGNVAKLTEQLGGGGAELANLADVLESLATGGESEDVDETKSEVKLLTKAEMTKVVEDTLAVCLTAFGNTPPASQFQLAHACATLQRVACTTFSPGEPGPVLALLAKVSPAFPLAPAFREWLDREVVHAADTEIRATFLARAIPLATGDLGLSTKVFLLKQANRVLLAAEQDGALAALCAKTNGRPPAWLEAIHSRIWRFNDPVTPASAGQLDFFRFELLQTTALTLRSTHAEVADLRKDVIKFAWNYIRLDDSICKQAAFVVTSFFIRAYDTPPKIATQVFVSLLKAHASDTRHLVRQALDLLAPVLPERLGSDSAWLRWPRRVLLEDGFTVTQVVNVYAFIVAHERLFYPARDQFVPNIVTAMGKLTILANPSPENQILAVDLAELVHEWEVRNSAEEEANAYAVPYAPREACVTYLVRYVCLSPVRVSESEPGRRALSVLGSLLLESLWGDVDVKLTYFDRFLVQVDFSNQGMLGYCLNALQVLGVVLSRKPAAWLVSHMDALERLLDKCLRLDNQDIQEVLQPVMQSVLAAIAATPADDETPVGASFLATVSAVVLEDLSGTTLVAAGVTLCWTLAQHQPQALDALLQPVMRTFRKLCNDHIALSHNSSTGGELEAKTTLRLLEQILHMSSMRISTLGDQRRVFLTLLAQLIERSVDRPLLLKIVAMVRGWVFAQHELFPTTKEKAGILQKMMVFEGRGDSELARAYYAIVIDIFEDPALRATELTVRLEQPFLVGTHLSDVAVRTKLVGILTASLDRDIHQRMQYVVRDQLWEAIAGYPWTNQAVQLLYGAFDMSEELEIEGVVGMARLGDIAEGAEELDATPTDALTEVVSAHAAFLSSLPVTTGEVLTPLTGIFYQSAETIHTVWVDLFSALVNATPTSRTSLTRDLVLLLAKDYHVRQMDSRPNVVQLLLAGAAAADLRLPPHLVKYLGATYDGWYPAMQLMERAGTTENAKVREATHDALCETYLLLQEEDLFYGLWRRRAKYFETNAALLYEQLGLWDRALQLYETAQIKARSGALPYGELEYQLWEDNWIVCTEKLQHWDVLTELAKHEGFTDLLLECAWRVADWTADKDPLEQSVRAVMDVPTPRRQVFETFLCLQGYAQQKTTIQELSKHCDEGIQLALRRWHALPSRFTQAHVPLLHTFQQYVEFMEALQVYGLLLTTNARNLDTKSQELKRVLQAWRERLPNIWDDINLWNDLVTWRQHAFGVINRVYMPLVPAVQAPPGTNANLYAYRGYHEIAWVVNRFAHVARKHDMPDVCVLQLAKIYTLPNIEIQEAFLKLREQAKCHYANKAELNTGMEVISNTNLAYFATPQKAEFFTLKGMFLAKLGVTAEADSVFSLAVQVDNTLPNAWAEWGLFNDGLFKEHPGDMQYAKHALDCFLQAAGLYKNAKSRRLLARILWLLLLDDTSRLLGQRFDAYAGEVPVWYWITFIPQLLTSLLHREAALARAVLVRIAKAFPQALHFQLRTTKEDFAVIQRQAAKEETPAETPNPAPWDHVDAIMGILKTTYPLLALLLELIVDQILQRFKCNADEDAYRLVIALLNDGVLYHNRLTNPKEDIPLPHATEVNILRFAGTVLPRHIRAEFLRDLIDSKPNLATYISKLRRWRDRLEAMLDRRYPHVLLETLCPHLSEFHYQKFEDIEIPGQYLLNKDSNAHFVKIERFAPTLDLVRGATSCYKRLRIRGSDGRLHPFAVQFPAARHSRREERMFQMFRIFNEALAARVQTRRRHISLTLPIAVPLSPHIRILNDDPHNVLMLQVYEQWCREKGVDRDAPFDYTVEHLRAAYDPRLPKPDVAAVRIEILTALQSQHVPNTVLENHFVARFPQFEDFWLFRKRFSLQYALLVFMTYMMCINGRQPHKIHIHERSGDVWTSDMLPSKVPSGRVSTAAYAGSTMDVPTQRAAPVFHNQEPVPFRLTPNIQKLIGEVGLEGVLAVHVLAIVRCLTEPEFDMEQYMLLFVRDEVVSWYAQQHRQSAQDLQLREMVRVNVEHVVKKTGGLAATGSGVATQHVLELVAQAVNPRNLAGVDGLWMPYY